MEARRPGSRRGEAAVSAVALAATMIAAWLVLTLPDAGTVAAGWRHLVFVSLLGAFGLASTAPPLLPTPCPAQLFAAFQLAVVAIALAGPWPRQPVLAAVGVTLAVAGAVTLLVEAPRLRLRTPLQAASFLIGLVSMVSIAPTFLGADLAGRLGQA